MTEFVPDENLSPYQQLKSAIVTGEFRPGAPLRESDLADRYAVSRTPVREALRRLEHDGLVEKTARGLLVRELSPEEILGIYEVRSVLEAAVAAAAARNHTTTDQIRLRAANNRYQLLDDLDADIRAQVNLDFHRAVWMAAHNTAFVDLLERLNLHLLRHPATTLTYADRWEVSKVDHQALVDAILRADPDEASVIARRHFESARDVRIQLWEDQLTQSPDPNRKERTSHK